MARKKKPEANPFDAPEIDFELDFDLQDFDITGDKPEEPTPQTIRSRVCRPKIDIRAISHHVAFRNAEEFVRHLDISEHARTFAWVSGDFIFGDMLEALITIRRVHPKVIYISSLGMSADNIDSLRTIMLYTKVEKVVLLLSGYFYSHEKFTLIPYLYKELDIENKLQVAFGNFHMKMICIETHPGHHLVIHGSANMRSSNSVEQVMVEEDEELYRFNAELMDRIAELYGTIDHSNPNNYYIRREKTWQAVQAVAGEGHDTSVSHLQQHPAGEAEVPEG